MVRVHGQVTSSSHDSFQPPFEKFRSVYAHMNREKLDKTQSFGTEKENKMVNAESLDLVFIDQLSTDVLLLSIL